MHCLKSNLNAVEKIINGHKSPFHVFSSSSKDSRLEFRHTDFMDVLTDILNLAGIEKSLLANRSIYKPWAIRFPCDLSIGFHVVTQGEMYVRAPKLKTPIHMKKGDILLAARGFNHEIATDLKTAAQKTIEFSDQHLSVAGKKPLVTFASGVYRLRDNPLHSLLQQIPNKILLRADEIPAHDPLHSALGLLSAELAANELGSEAVTKNLLDILFHYILRNWMNSEQGKSQWQFALKDSNMMKALRVIHDSPQTDWSVDSLADASGLSRAAFAKKFKEATGDTPARYVAKIRIQLATRIFRSSAPTVEEVAAAVGYQDAFVFSKVFKRIQGMSPRDYKRAIASEVA